MKQFLGSRILRRWVIRIDAGGRFPRNRVACDAVVAVAMGAVPSKFSVFNLAAAANEVARVVVLVKAAVGHRATYAVGARWWAEEWVCGSVPQMRMEGAGGIQRASSAGGKIGANSR